MEKEEIRKEALSRETVSIPELQREFSIAYPEARAVAEELVRSGAFKYESGVVFRRTEQGEREFRGETENVEETANDELMQTLDEACDRTLNRLKKQRARFAANELHRRREELIKKIKEESDAKSEEESEDTEEEEQTDGEKKEEDESDLPFGSLRFEPNLIVAGKQLTWERLGDYSFRMRVVWLKYSSGDDCALKVTFTENGSVYLTDDGYVFETVSKKSGEIAARMKLNMAELSWDFMKIENETLVTETSVTHLIADAFRFYSAIDRIMD